MAITKKFSRFRKSKIRKVDDNIGVYELARRVSGEYKTLYFGEGRLRSRLLYRLPDGSKGSFIGVTHFRYEETNDKRRARQLERGLLKEYYEEHDDLPRYNDYDEMR